MKVESMVTSADSVVFAYGGGVWRRDRKVHCRAVVLKSCAKWITFSGVCRKEVAIDRLRVQMIPTSQMEVYG